MWRRRLTVPDAADSNQRAIKDINEARLTNTGDFARKCVASKPGRNSCRCTITLESDEVGDSSSDVGGGLYNKH